MIRKHRPPVGRGLLSLRFQKKKKKKKKSSHSLFEKGIQSCLVIRDAARADGLPSRQYEEGGLLSRRLPDRGLVTTGES